MFVCEIIIATFLSFHQCFHDYYKSRSKSDACIGCTPVCSICGANFNPANTELTSPRVLVVTSKFCSYTSSDNSPFNLRVLRCGSLLASGKSCPGTLNPNGLRYGLLAISQNVYWSLDVLYDSLALRVIGTSLNNIYGKLSEKHQRHADFDVDAVYPINRHSLHRAMLFFMKRVCHISQSDLECISCGSDLSNYFSLHLDATRKGPSVPHMNLDLPKMPSLDATPVCTRADLTFFKIPQSRTLCEKWTATVKEKNKVAQHEALEAIIAASAATPANKADLEPLLIVATACNDEEAVIGQPRVQSLAAFFSKLASSAPLPTTINNSSAYLEFDLDEYDSDMDISTALRSQLLEEYPSLAKLLRGYAKLPSYLAPMLKRIQSVAADHSKLVELHPFDSLPDGGSFRDATEAEGKYRIYAHA